MEEVHKRTLASALKLLALTYRLDRNLAQSRGDNPAVVYFNAQIDEVERSEKWLADLYEEAADRLVRIEQLDHEIRKMTAAKKQRRKQQRRRK